MKVAVARRCLGSKSKWPKVEDVGSNGNEYKRLWPSLGFEAIHVCRGNDIAELIAIAENFGANLIYSKIGGMCLHQNLKRKREDHDISSIGLNMTESNSAIKEIMES